MLSRVARTFVHPKRAENASMWNGEIVAGALKVHDAECKYYYKISARTRLYLGWCGAIKANGELM